ncbi:MAG: hypothetical protein ACTHKT_09925 [Solirubrobacterales bacterium]
MNRSTAIAVLVALVLAPVAAARADVVDGGNLRLKPSGALAKAFAREGVKLTGLKPAKGGQAGVALPISSGLSEIQHGSGYFFLGGGFRLRVGKRAMTVRRLVLNENEHWLRGVVNGTAMKIAEPVPQEASADGFGVDLAIGSLKLSGRAASVFNRKLGLRGVFKAGRSLGSLTGVARVEFLTVRGGEITFTIEESFRQKLTSVGAFVGASGSATLRGTPTVVVSTPIEGGQIAPDASIGVLLSQGGLSFTQHDEPFDHTIAFLDTNIGLESHLVTGDANYSPNPQQIPFTGPIAALTSNNVGGVGGGNPETGVVSSAPIRAVLHPSFAKVLNEVLGAPKGKPDLFTAGEFIGAFSYEARTR